MNRLVCLSCLLAACVPGSFERVVDPEVVATSADGLDGPRDLAFHPLRPDELWVVSQDDDSVTIVFDASDEAERTSDHILDPARNHFLEEVVTLDFDRINGQFATCGDTRNTYDGQAPPDDFMGPALWSSDLETFGKTNPDAVEYLEDQFGMPVDLGSHLDMLHESPRCMGVAWDQGNVYWVFDGMDGAIVRYDFAEDHDHGFDDHSDGVISRYVSGSVERVARTVSHLVLDRGARQLYIADSGNNRIAVFDVDSGTRGITLATKEAGVDHHRMDGGVIETFVDGAEVGMVRPAGIDLIDGHVVVTDAGTGHVLIFDLQGNLIEDLDTGRGPDTLAGITGPSLDDLWLVDGEADEVLRIR